MVGCCDRSNIRSMHVTSTLSRARLFFTLTTSCSVLKLGTVLYHTQSQSDDSRSDNPESQSMPRLCHRVLVHCGRIVVAWCGCRWWVRQRL